MKIFILFGQRKCSYAGQYAPETLEVFDEFGLEENGDYLIDKREEHLKTGDFEAVKWVSADINSALIDQVLRPVIPRVEAKNVQPVDTDTKGS